MISATPRAELRANSGINTHWPFDDPNVYASHGDPNPALLQAVVDCGFGMIREGFWPKNPAQQKAWQWLADRGVGVFTFITDQGAATAAAALAVLASRKVAPHIVGVGGLNEPNGNGGSAWPKRTVDVQTVIRDQLRGNETKKIRALAPLAAAAVVGPSLRHNGVKDLDADYRAVGAAGIAKQVDALDLHYYGEPSTVEAEVVRAASGMGGHVGWHTENGRVVPGDCDGPTGARFAVEALLRGYLAGRKTFLYELADETRYGQDREARFGIIGKPAAAAVKQLLAIPDGGEAMPGWIDTKEQGASDAQVVVTSEGDQHWTVHLLRQTDATATLVLPKDAGLVCDVGTHSLGEARNHRYAIALEQTMVTANVRPAG